jgi:hypothetical protein
MLRIMKKLWLAIVLITGIHQTQAFTLLGPSTEWMVPRLGYPGSLFGGPMSLGEEYRWNVPVVYYAYSPAFMDYFGQRGVEEIEKAIQILNALPSMDDINLNDFPLSSRRQNFRAQALGLLDLKSYTLSTLLNHMGITDPTRFVYTLRNRWIIGEAPTNFYVIKRNFDPVTWQHSSFINGQLWTYNTILDGPQVSIVPTVTVDPLAFGGFMNSPVTTDIHVGGFWTGLTRDDVGGLRYIYRSSNYNVENAAPTAFGVGFGGVDGGSPWGIPGGGVGGILGTNFVNTALRPGVGKVTFQRVFFDSVFGFFRTNLVSHPDRFVTNSTIIRQTLQRAQQAPDILFNSADLQGPVEGDPVGNFPASSHLFIVWENNDELNGVEGNYGPGVIHPAIDETPAFIFTFNTVGPTFWNIWPNFLSETTASRFFIWGSFDGTTNAPFIYPHNSSIQEVERQVLAPPPDIPAPGLIVTPWTPVQPPPPVDVDPGIGDDFGGGGGGIGGQ